jgi:hypothetical protein
MFNFLFWYDSLEFYFFSSVFSAFESKIRQKIIWLIIERNVRIYFIALNVEWNFLFYFVGFDLGAVKKITALSWPLKKLQHICCNIWNIDFLFLFFFFFYILLFVINCSYVNKYFNKFYFFWVKIKLKVLTFIVFLLKYV